MKWNEKMVDFDDFARITTMLASALRSNPRDAEPFPNTSMAGMDPIASASRIVPNITQTTGENICIDGGMTRQMIYHGEHGWNLEVAEETT